MSLLELRGLRSRSLAGVDLQLGAGLHAAVGAAGDGTEAIIEAASGLRRHGRRTVLLDGEEPHRSPRLRRHLGALLPRETLPPGRTVSDAVARALRARRDPRAPQEILDVLDIAGWSARPADALGPAERRTIALAIALTVPRPRLLALYEPLSATVGVARPRIIELVNRAVSSGGVILYATASLRDAAEVGGSLIFLDRGRVTRRIESPLTTALMPGTPTVLLVRTDRVRALARALLEEPGVGGVAFSERAAPGELSVHGEDPEGLALAVLRASRKHHLSLVAITRQAAPLELVRAATAGMERAAYDQAYRSAHLAAPPATPPRAGNGPGQVPAPAPPSGSAPPGGSP